MRDRDHAPQGIMPTSTLHIPMPEGARPPPPPPQRYAQDYPEEPAVTVEARVDRLERLVLQLQRAVIRMQEQAIGS